MVSDQQQPKNTRVLFTLCANAAEVATKQIKKLKVFS
jgi:hypothetical protein